MLVKSDYMDLIHSLILKKKPQNIVQIGLSGLADITATCDAASQVEGASITLIEPDLYSNDHYSAIPSQLQQRELDHCIEFLTTPPDQVLPDLYFQEQTIELAIINPCSTYDETFVSFYYLNKMLPKDAVILINNAQSNIMRTLCRHMIGNVDYIIKGGLKTTPPKYSLEKLLRNQYKKAPDFIKNQIAALVHPDLLATNEELSTLGTIIALQKTQGQEHEETNVEAMLEALT